MSAPMLLLGVVGLAAILAGVFWFALGILDLGLDVLCSAAKGQVVHD